MAGVASSQQIGADGAAFNPTRGRRRKRQGSPAHLPTLPLTVIKHRLHSSDYLASGKVQGEKGNRATS